MKYKTLRKIMIVIMDLISDVEIVGMEKMPEGNVIFAANHLGRFDTGVLLYALEREDLIIAVAEKYKNHWLYGAIGRSVDAIWLNRFETDFASLREILERMKKGGVFVIAPEGTRSRTGSMQKGKMGVAFLAAKSGYPVVPVALTGTEDEGMRENFKKFRRSKIKAVVGDPFYIEIPKGKGREEAMQQATDEIMCQIAAMLPESYRGYYKDHSRVKDLLSKQNVEV